MTVTVPKLIELEWRYAEGGVVLHGFTSAPFSYAAARCGYAPPWYRKSWLGTGSQQEYDRAETLPRCRRCVRLFVKDNLIQKVA